MQALYAFLVLSLIAAACFIGGAYALGGLGPALLTAGVCAAVGAAFMRRGIGHG